MKSYFYMDHTRKGCFTPLHLQIWNLSLKSMQSHVIESHLECSLCAGGFFSQDFDKKAWKRLTTYLALKYITVVRNWSPLKSLNCLSPVLKMAAFISHFVQATVAQNAALLKCCRPRTSDTAISAFRNVSVPVSGLIYQVLAISLHFLT